MKTLLEQIGKLKVSEVKELVDARIKQFKSLGSKSNDELFKELCFCLLTANCSAGSCMAVQAAAGNDFLKLSEKQLAARLKQLGYRFPNTRAHYIAGARKRMKSLKETLSSFSSESQARDWLVQNIKGLGYKEASHFLRNIGYDTLAIIDFHIIDILAKNKVIERPKTLTRQKYLEIEALLGRIADELNLTLAELDLYLWYAETGKVLK